ncbi:MAG TPA: c-type cytochrome biogenesis protein CcmI [Pseudolabrys sp.]|jgi:cytochrome c-type biogenesis protein CcmH|nr:c-type cytochrome biogenesis protein CcmI [Pseudolabrys sp.]
MALWLAFALMTAAAIFAVLWPLSRSGRMQSGSDAEVYRDQLDEIERDRSAGLIGEAEADAARIEVSRRLIAAGDVPPVTASADPTAGLWRRRTAALAALILVPFAAGTIYLMHGSPQLPGEPLAGRLDAKADHSIVAMIAQVERHLETNPKDARGWEVLAPVYLRLGRFDDAVKARRNAIEYGGDSAQREADLGEALVAAANGVVTADAKQAFDQATAQSPDDPKARFYLGLAAQQDGDTDKAADIWQKLLKDAPPNAPWATAVQQALASAGRAPPPGQKAAPGPNAEDVAAASKMSEAERGEMVRGMVTQLAERLKNDGSDVEGWLRLVRAYVVLGERDKASEAVSNARRALANDADKVRRIEDFAKSVGLNG